MNSTLDFRDKLTIFCVETSDLQVENLKIK
jgi:hypothetical protein